MCASPVKSEAKTFWSPSGGCCSIGPKLNFIFNVPDSISKNLVLCSLCTMDLFTNKAQFDTGFSERLKLKDDAVLVILDPTVMSQHTSMSNCFYYMVTIALSVITYLLIGTEYLCIFNLNHSSVYLWRMQAVKHRQLLANHSSGRLLPSLQSPCLFKQSIHQGVKTGPKIAYYFYIMFFYVKILITL